MSQTLQSLLNDGARLLAERRIEGANRLAADLLQRFRAVPAVRIFAADAALARGEGPLALSQLDAIPAPQSTEPPVLLRRARILLQMRRRGEAREIARVASGRVAQDPWQLGTLAGILRDCQDTRGALHWLERAHAGFPGHPAILYDLAVAEFQLSRVDAAEQHLAQLLQHQPRHPAALRLRSQLRRWDAAHNHVAELEALLATADEPRLRAAVGYALGKEYEDLDECTRAFTALSEGARAQRGLLAYDSAAECGALEQLRLAFPSADPIRARSGYTGSAPIFVVGLPRSGTTLVERILGSHSALESVGEITDFPDLLAGALGERGPDAVEASRLLDYHALGRRYAESASQLAGGATRFIDKLPYNFLYCGYILAALPEARIVHLVRDPMDSGFAVFKTLFTGAYNWSYDLEEIADYYLAYHQLMCHWRVLASDRILDVHYESLVQDPETVSRELLAWCGLPWEEGVLGFHTRDDAALTASALQVRRPIYTDSVGAWKKFAADLAPLATRLGVASQDVG
jgi:tetratricopeptide (TPR) repeat protein